MQLNTSTILHDYISENPARDGITGENNSNNTLRKNDRMHKILSEKPYEDVTQQWLDAVDQDRTGTVIENDYFEFAGMRYDASNAKLYMKFGREEHVMAEWLKDTFHEDVQLVPITSPFGRPSISTPDYFFKGEKWDLKTPNVNTKSTIRDLVKKAKKKDGTIQANNFIIDISRINDNQQNIENNIFKLYTNFNTLFVNNVIVVKNRELIRIARKKR